MESEYGASDSSDPEHTGVLLSRPDSIVLRRKLCRHNRCAATRGRAVRKCARSWLTLGNLGSNCFWQRMLSAHELAQGVKAVTYL
jgi:hypothetical protein